MIRQCFYSFHYQQDSWRVSQIRNIGIVEGNKAASDNDWETLATGGETAIKRWINGQMYGRSCVVVLIGAHTANRRWVQYEIEKGWNDRKGVLGIHIHNLRDRLGNTSARGSNPFSKPNIKGIPLASIVKTYGNPPIFSEFC